MKPHTAIAASAFLALESLFCLVLLPACSSFPMLRQRALFSPPQRNLALSPVPMADQTNEALSSSDGPMPVRKRWRRRRKDSAVVPDVVVEENTAGAQDQDEQTSAAASQCPIFSMTFPRYRIDLTSNSSKDSESEQRRARRVQRKIITKLVKPNSNDNSGDDRKLENEGNAFGRMGAMFKGVLNSGITSQSSKNKPRVRNSVESLYAEEVRQGMFRWMPSTAVDSSTTADEEFVSAAAYWRMASDIIISQSSMVQGQQNQQQSWYLALPETTQTVAQNLCDVSNWYADLLENNDDGERIEVEGGPMLLRAELDSRSDDIIPVVHFTLTIPNKRKQEEEIDRRRQQRASLPTGEVTEKRTKAWVKRLLVQLGICPFTKSEVKSGQGMRDLGVQPADIMYRHSSALSSGSDMYLLMADAWEAISDMVAAGPSGVSSILLSAPGFDEDFNLWAGPVFAMLETCVGAIQAEEMIGVVCFHPQYVTPDGKSWPGFGHMHSVPRLKQWYSQYSLSTADPTLLSDNDIAAGGAWQRRTPHAVINVLRAEQLEAAEGRRSTGELYERNIRVLVGEGSVGEEEGSVGLEKLKEDLERERSLV